MQKFILLHSNDIHGRIAGLARIATLVEQVRAENAATPVLYFDAGDIEENSVRVSSLTKGVAMHRLLSKTHCEVEVVGNGGVPRYGYQVLEDYAKAAGHPLLLANLRLPDGGALPGVQATTMVQVGERRLGVIGVTATMGGTLYGVFGLQELAVVPLVRDLAADLRQQGADAVILLSHLGLSEDREIAPQLQEDVDIIIGAHSHDLLPNGEQIGRVWIVQAGQFAEHLGRLDLAWEGERLLVQEASTLTVTEDIPPSSQVLDAVHEIEEEMEQFLQRVIGELAEAFDLAFDRECKAVNLMADMLRERMQAEVAVVTAGVSFSESLPAGPLRRAALWNISTSTANPGIVEMTGAQLLAIVRKGQDQEFAQEKPRSMRGLPRGLLHLSGATIRDGQLLVGEQAVEMERVYRVAGSDWELEKYGGYVLPEWELQTRYDVPTILREALEEYLAEYSPIRVDVGRLGRLAV